MWYLMVRLISGVVDRDMKMKSNVKANIKSLKHKKPNGKQSQTLRAKSVL